VKSGSFDIKFQARDEFGNESEVVTFSVTVKKSKKKKSKFLGIGAFDNVWIFLSLSFIASFRLILGSRCLFYGKNN
jgi:hypothetical protein